MPAAPAPPAAPAAPAKIGTHMPPISVSLPSAPKGDAAAPAAPAPPSDKAAEYRPAGFDAYDTLDKMAGDDGKPEPSPTPSRDESGKFKKPDEKPAPDPNKAAEKPAETPPEKPGEKASDKPERAGELRRQRDQYRTDNERLTKELQAIKSGAPPDQKLQTLETQLKEAREQLTAREQRLSQLESEITSTNFERSEEYETNFKKPVAEAYARGAKKILELDVQEVRDEEGNVKQEARQATDKDFDTLMQFSRDADAMRYAKQMFGDLAPIAMAQRERVLELNQRRIDEIGNRRTNAEKINQESMQRQQAEQKAVVEYFEKQIQAGTEKYPHLFKTEDPEEAKLLESGEYWAKRAFNGGKPLREGDKQMTAQEKVDLDAAIYNQARAYPMLASRVKKLTARIKELEADLAGYEDTETLPGEKPRAGGPAPEGGNGQPSSAGEAFDNTFGKR